MTATNAKLALHHVGGREGGGLTLPARFQGEAVRALYDADADCLDQATRDNAGVVALPYCLAGRSGSRQFNLTFDPNMSSLLPLNPDYAGWTYPTMDPHRGPLDYVYGEAGRCVAARELETTSLDDLFHDGGAPVPPPDDLSLDVQGMEYDILAGGCGVLRAHTLAIEAEVGLQPLYRGQKLFGEVDALLRGLGFTFARFTRLYDMTPARPPLGQRDAGFHAFGEALWLRDIESLVDFQPEIRAVMSAKLAFLALAHGQFAFAAACLRRRKQAGWDAAAASAVKATGWHALLEDLWGLIEAGPATLPPSFGDRYDVAGSQARFAPSAARPGMIDWFPRIVDKLRWDLRRAGERRLCLLPHGAFANACGRSLENRADRAALEIFDNRPRPHEAPPSRPVSEIGTEDFSLIASASYAEPLRHQLLAACGVASERILTLDDLAAGRFYFPALIEPTPLENCLVRSGFEELARNLGRRRACWTFPPEQG